MLQELPRERFRALQAESNQELFPLDPFTEHDPRSLGAQAIESAKRSTYDEMLSLSDQFEGSSNVLVKTAAILAMECHFNHFRGGPGDIHYSAHLLETAKRVDLHFSTQSIPGIYERITTQFGENLDPKAIAIAIALLHDSLEDFHENFRNQPGTQISVEEGRDAAIYRIENRLGEVVSGIAAHQIVSRIKALSIDNKDEFPTSDFLNSAFRDGYTRTVILADKDHNLATLPTFLPSYSAFVVPAQFGLAVENTPFATSYAQSVIRSCIELNRRLDKSNENAQQQDSTHRQVNTWIQLICEYEGSPGIFRANQFYDKLQAKIAAGDFDDLLASESASIDSAIAAIENARTFFPSTLSPILMDFAPFPVTSQRVRDIFAKQLGPVEFWGVDISISGTRDALKEVINQVALRTGRRITGYFTESKIGIKFHISRIPRGVGLPIDQVESYEDTLGELVIGLERSGLSPQVSRPDQISAPEVQSLFGLEEGYYENRRRELLENMPEASEDMEALVSEIKERFGDLSMFSCENPYDPSCSFAITHTVEEVEHFLIGSDFVATSAEIYAAGPKSGAPTKLSIYSEPAVLVTGELPTAEPIPNVLITIASELAQARFSVEYPQAQTATNVEVVGLSEGISAQRV